MVITKTPVRYTLWNGRAVPASVALIAKMANIAPTLFDHRCVRAVKFATIQKQPKKNTPRPTVATGRDPADSSPLRLLRWGRAPLRYAPPMPNLENQPNRH